MTDEGQKPTTVRARDCTCPGTPHPDGDEVYLHPSLPFLGGVAARSVLAAFGDPVVAEETLGRVYLRHGIAGWNLLDGRKRPRPCTPDAIEAEFSWRGGGRAIVEACDDLYQEEILAPLRERLGQLSELGSMGTTPEETSRTKRSTSKRRKPS